MGANNHTTAIRCLIGTRNLVYALCGKSVHNMLVMNDRTKSYDTLSAAHRLLDKGNCPVNTKTKTSCLG